MIRRLAAIVLLAPLALAAQAGEGEPSTYVSIDEVAEVGKAVPVEGITSTGQPDRAALDVFAASGYAVVIDMRGPDEDRGMEDFAGAVEASGMQYVSFPVVGHDAISFETATKLDALLQDVDGPVVMHCGSGNRVGAILALRKSLAGASDAEAIAYGKEAGLTRLEPVVEDVLQSD